MTAFSHNSLQQSIYELLSNDSVLNGMVAGVFDRIPTQHSAFPYITLGEMESRDWSSKTHAGIEYSVRLHIFSREGGRKQTASLMERLYTLLHEASLSIPGYEVILMRHIMSSIALEKDGWTYHGNMVFRLLVHPES